MSKAIENTVYQATESAVAELGYELADVSFAREADVEGWVLTLFIYHSDGISLDDCEKVSRAVDPIIEQLDPTEEPYFLSVSSLGLDRPFSSTRDYERYLEREIEIKLYAPVDVEELKEKTDASSESKPENESAFDSKKTNKKKRSAKKYSGKRKEFVGTLRVVNDESLTLEIDGCSHIFARDKIAKACPSIQWQ